MCRSLSLGEGERGYVCMRVFVCVCACVCDIYHIAIYLDTLDVLLYSYAVSLYCSICFYMTLTHRDMCKCVSVHIYTHVGVGV